MSYVKGSSPRIGRRNTRKNVTPMIPHIHMVATENRGHPDRKWVCVNCDVPAEADINDLGKTSCTYTPPPCEFCGETPICAQDCAGIAQLFARADVYVIGAPQRRRQRDP